MFHHTCTEVEQANEPVIFFVAMASLVVRPLDDVVSQGLGQIIHIHWALLKRCTLRANDRLCSEVCVFGQNVVTVCYNLIQEYCTRKSATQIRYI